MEDNRYGYGQNPPYSLYQGEDGKWGLVDKDGVKLNAVFTRSQDGEVFSCALGEVGYFDENEGFNLLAWCDPDEAWFNFTYDNDEYPSRWCLQAALSDIVILAQCPARSGSLHTMRFARKYDKQCFAAVYSRRTEANAGNYILIDNNLSKPI